LSDLDILKLNEEESMIYQKQLNVKLRLPINELGDTEIFQPWLTRSIFSYVPDGAEQKPIYYYLHPETILIDDAGSDKPKAVLCSSCAVSLKKGTIPTNTVGDEIDFGVAARLGLEQPTAREFQIISYVRHYYNIIKIESNSRTLREHQQLALRGCSIMFEQDAPQVVTNLLSPETMNSNVLLHFVGYTGEFDSLYKKTMQTKSADVFGRSWVIYQWLCILHVINRLNKIFKYPCMIILKQHLIRPHLHLWQPA
jgi:hypothetical protein